MAVILYEVLPVTLVSKHVVLIRHQQEKSVAPWLIHNLPNVHPNESVLANLVGFFGNIFDAGRTIVHSTSWRYEAECDQLLLTYLAVLPQGDWVDHLLALDHILVEPIGEVGIQYGDHLFPPEQIEQPYVLSHALDHLASLSTYDPAIRAVLEPEWGEILESRMPKSAGYLQVCR